MNDLLPIICTLTDEQRSSRTTTWQDVIANSVTRIEELPDGYRLTLSYAKISHGDIHDLVQAERDCCRWMNLEFEDGAPPILKITSRSLEGKTLIGNILAIQRCDCC
jgi:hypothetical protein